MPLQHVYALLYIILLLNSDIHFHTRLRIGLSGMRAASFANEHGFVQACGDA